METTHKWFSASLNNRQKDFVKVQFKSILCQCLFSKKISNTKNIPNSSTIPGTPYISEYIPYIPYIIFYISEISVVILTPLQLLFWEYSIMKSKFCKLCIFCFLGVFLRNLFSKKTPFTGSVCDLIHKKY